MLTFVVCAMCLASIDTIKDATIMFPRDSLNTYAYAIEVLKQLYSLTIHSNAHGLRRMADLATALRGHPSLQNLKTLHMVVLLVVL
jgi:hypothetical protein